MQNSFVIEFVKNKTTKLCVLAMKLSMGKVARYIHNHDILEIAKKAGIKARVSSVGNITFEHIVENDIILLTYESNNCKILFSINQLLTLIHLPIIGLKTWSGYSPFSLHGKQK